MPKSIRDMANEYGVTLRALRYYESKGLLTPERRGNERLYDLKDEAALAFVLDMQRMGFILSEIRLMWTTSGGDRPYLTLAQAEVQLATLTRRREELDQAITALKALFPG